MTNQTKSSANSRLGLLLVFYVAYLFLGASIFDAIESPNEAKIIKDLNDYIKKFRQTHNTCLTDDELNNFIKLISKANERGISPLKNISSDQKWTFGQSVFFAGTVLSTIGYGNVSPMTQSGKLFCMLFAIIGIPITLVLLTSIIERLMSLTNSLFNYINYKLQPYLRALCTTNRIDIGEMRVLFAFLCLLIVLIFFILIPAGIYSSIENWSYLNAFYYCFISLSTVGLGDYVPGERQGQENLHFYKIASTLYLIIGVTVMVWLLQIFSETPEFNIYKYFTLAEDGQLTKHQIIKQNNHNNCQETQLHANLAFQQTEIDTSLNVVD